MEREDLMRVIEECSAATGLSPSTICGRAVGNSRLYARLSGGGECVPSTAKRVVAYINSISENERAA